MAISNEEVEALLEKGQDDKAAGNTVRPYDFTAQRINRTQLPLLEVINKNFADRDAQVLGASTDNEFVHLAWRQNHVDLKGKIGRAHV